MFLCRNVEINIPKVSLIQLAVALQMDVSLAMAMPLVKENLDRSHLIDKNKTVRCSKGKEYANSTGSGKAVLFADTLYKPRKSHRQRAREISPVTG